MDKKNIPDENRDLMETINCKKVSRIQTDHVLKGADDRQGKDKEKFTSSFLTSSLTLAVVSDDCFPLDASLISVDRKFLHFFTFSSVSCKQKQLNIFLKHIDQT